MITDQSVEELKSRVREHGQYRQLAEEMGLSESWVAKFATQPGTNYTLHTVQKVANYFAQKSTN